MEGMRIKFLPFLLMLTLMQTFFITHVNSQTPTHSVFVEIFSSTWAEPCRKEQSIIQQLTENSSHIAHFVVYHLQDVWSTTDGVERATELNIRFVPSHAYDGGFSRSSGSIINASEIELQASRNVHLIGLTVTKVINGNLLSSQVFVAERNGYSFRGQVIAYVIENDMTYNGTSWDSVYRDQIFEQGIFLKPNSYEVISGNWSIPNHVKANDIEIIVVVFDKTTTGQYDPYAIQSASSQDRELTISEFNNWIPLLITSTILITLLMSKRIKVRQDLIS